MKVLERKYPWNPLVGVNPFERAMEEDGHTLTYMAEQFGVLARIAGYFSGFSAVCSDDVKSISFGTSYVRFNLAEEARDSRFVHALAQFTGLDFVKSRADDGKSIDLEAKLIPEGHALAKIGIVQVTVAGYLPQSCRVVVKEHTPLADDERAVYERLLSEGRPIYETVCTEVRLDETTEPATEYVAEIPIEAEGLEVPF